MRLEGEKASDTAGAEDEVESVLGAEDPRGDFSQQLSAAGHVLAERLRESLSGIEGIEEAAILRLQEQARAHAELLARDVGEAADAMQEASIAVVRKATKAQAAWFQVKLDTLRKAARVQLTNQACEMEASHNRQLESTVQQLSTGGDTLLQEAHQKLEELQRKHSGLELAKQADEDTLRGVQKVLDQTERRVTKLDAEVSAFREEAAYAKASLQDALKDLKLAKGEKRTLGEQVAQLVSAYEEAKRSHETVRDELASVRQQCEQQCDQARLTAEAAQHDAHEARHDADVARAELVAERTKPPDTIIGELRIELAQLRTAHTDLAAERDALEETRRVSLAEAAAAAERAAMMQTEECQRQVAQLGQRLREEVEAAMRGEVVDSEDRLRRAQEEMRQLTVTISERDSEVKALRAELSGMSRAHAAEVAEKDCKFQAMSDARDAAMKAAMQAGDAMELLAAQEEARKLKLEIQSCQATLSHALEDLDLKVEENKTLGEQVRDLVANYESAKVSHAQVSEQLEAERLEAAEAAEVARGRVVDVQRSFEDRVAELSAENEQLREELGEVTREGQRLEWWQEEAARLREELKQEQRQLREATDAVQSLTSENARLSEHTHELQGQLRTAEAALTQSKHELGWATMAIEKSQGELDRVTSTANKRLVSVHEEAQKERTLLVQAALQSLQQLRTHLTSTLSGLRVQSKEGDAPPDPRDVAAWQRWKHRWGVTSQGGESTTVRLIPPEMPPLSVLPMALTPPRVSTRPATANGRMRTRSAPGWSSSDGTPQAATAVPARVPLHTGAAWEAVTCSHHPPHSTLSPRSMPGSPRAGRRVASGGLARQS